jgi:hypothetical protein
VPRDKHQDSAGIEWKTKEHSDYHVFEEKWWRTSKVDRTIAEDIVKYEGK